MSSVKKALKKTLAQALWHSIGRTNLVRLGRFLSNEGRLDITNDPSCNGEQLVQSELIRHHNKKTALCIFDVGANIGEWSHSMVQTAQIQSDKLSIYAFEPFPDTYQTLLQNIKHWDIQGIVQTNNIALSSTQEEHEFHSLGSGIGTNGFYRSVSDSERSDTMQYNTSTVPATTVDIYCKENNIKHIHLLKIDTEGHDFEVILGCRTMLQQNAIDIIQFEYNHRWIYARRFLKDVFDCIKDFDLALGKVTPKGIEFYNEWHSELESYREANYLLMKKSFINMWPTIEWWKN